MADNVKQFQQVDALAREVLGLDRNTLLVKLRFLDLALSRFTLASYPGTLATDGQHLFYDPYYVLSSYKAERARSVRDYLHTVLHCVFRHLFAGPQVDRRCWDLACDIAVEAVIRSLELPCAACRREAAQAEVLSALPVHPLTAEKLYRYFLDQSLDDAQLSLLRKPFLADDHRAWYLPVKGQGSGGGEASDRSPERAEGHRHQQRQGASSRRSQSAAETERCRLEAEWKAVSRRIQVDLDTFSRSRGDGGGELVQALRAVNRERYDYADFLRRFMALGAVMAVNDDEFDYIFYTYGLALYQNIPLVEPLEYKEVRRVRELVIVIDTSGSVSGDTVQRFVTKTYNLLRQQENFFTKIDLHILQCDAQVQEDRRITCQKDFETYLETMELHGFGGTDFRPAFQYVDELVRAGEFTDLGGLIYFTDGHGAFPALKPDYETAFVFLDSGDGAVPEVPVWAIRLVLEKEEL